MVSDRICECLTALVGALLLHVIQHSSQIYADRVGLCVYDSTEQEFPLRD